MASKRKGNLINIQGKTEVTDPFYRYKMEEVILSSQKGKVVFENIDNVCKDIGRSVQMVLKFLKIHFGTSIEYKGNIAMTTKELTRSEIQQAIYKFIDEFVLCRKCGNPETVLEDKKKRTIMSCKACSFSGDI